MKLDIFDIDEFVKQNHVQQVTDPIFFDSSGSPKENGLLSYTIFGMTDNDRKHRYGYIDLVGKATNIHYLHPLVYLVISRLGSIKYLINGSKYAIIENKKIVLIPEDKLSKYPKAETGIEFIYDNWDNINWLTEEEEEVTDSIDKKSRLKFLRSLKKNEAFVTKWLVMPAFYRDQSANSRSLGDSINDLYKTLISRANAMQSGGRFSFFGEESKYKIQLLLVQIYNETTRVVKGKNSLFKKHILGKTIDYSASNVITAPQISSSESVDEFPVKFGYGRFPLPTLLALFQPFFVNKITEVYSRVFVPMIFDMGRGSVKKVDYSLYNTEAAEKLVKFFIKSPNERFKPLEFEYTDVDNVKHTGTFKFYEAKTKADADNGKWIERPYTIADLFTQLAAEICEDKHVWVSRFPIDNFKNIYPCRIAIATTVKTRTVYLKYSAFNNDYFKAEQYPYIKWEGNPEHKPDNYYNFFEVMCTGNAYLKAMGGDYDGDMVYMKGVFSKEANAEADKLVYSKSNFLTVEGKAIRSISKIGKEALMSLYELTKDPII